MTPVAKTRKRFVTKPGRKTISRYLYVEVRAWFNKTYQPVPGASIRQEDVFGGEPVSFADVTVKSHTIEQAYQLGAAAMDTLRAENPAALSNHFTGQFLNDYVVKL